MLRQKKRKSFFNFNKKLKIKKGEILVENIIFIILNLIFLTILILFLLNQGSSTYLTEQIYAKEIALMIDSSKSNSIIQFNMEKAQELAEKNNLDFRESVSITGNMVNVKLTNRGNGYFYSFFNDVNVIPSPIVNNENEYTGEYSFNIVENEKN